MTCMEDGMEDDQAKGTLGDVAFSIERAIILCLIPLIYRSTWVVIATFSFVFR